MHVRALGLWAEAAPPVVYLHIAAKSFQKNLAYRAANLAGIVTNTFFGAIYVSIYTALLRGRGTVGGLDTANAVTYAVISQSPLWPCQRSATGSCRRPSSGDRSHPANRIDNSLSMGYHAARRPCNLTAAGDAGRDTNGNYSETKSWQRPRSMLGFVVSGRPWKRMPTGMARFT